MTFQCQLLLPRSLLEELPPDEPRDRVPEDRELPLEDRFTVDRDELLEELLVFPTLERLRLGIL